MSAVEPIEKASAAARSVAIVTEASRRIGAGVARQLLSDGWRVALAARSESGLKDICMEAGASNAVTVLRDLRDPAFAERLKEETWGYFGRIDALLKIAGDAPQASVLELSDAQWEQTFSLKHFAAQRLTRAV